MFLLSGFRHPRSLLADCGDADVGMAPGAAHQRALLRASTSELELVEMTQLTKQELRNGGIRNGLPVDSLLIEDGRHVTKHPDHVGRELEKIRWNFCSSSGQSSYELFGFYSKLGEQY